MSKFKIGDKVIPTKKTVGRIGMYLSETIKKAKLNNQNYLFVVDVDCRYNHYLCGDIHTNNDYKQHWFAGEKEYEWFDEDDLIKFKSILEDV